MPLKTEAGSDFASILNSAMRTPADFESMGKDLPDGFPLESNPAHRMVETSEDGIAGVTAFDFKIHRDVFLIFRPWDACARCGADLASGAASLPDVGDYLCPHTKKEEYETTINDTLSGKHIFGSEQEYPQKDGSLLMSVRWFEKKSKAKKATKVGVDGTSPEPDL